MQKRNLRTGRVLWAGCAVILIGVPFHALFTAWFADNFGHFDLIRLWKEFILLGLAIASIYLLIRHPALRRDMLKSRTVQLMTIFIGFTAFMTLVGLLRGDVTTNAAAYGFIIDTRMFVFLLVILLAGHLAPLPVKRRRWIFGVAAVVVVFGLLQQFVLPADILRHVGYGPHTLPAFQPVDNKPDIARVQSSLRGPNPLGAYLVTIIASAVVLGLINKKRRVAAYGLSAAGFIVLVGTYSRSALLGLMLTFVVFGWLSVKNGRTRTVFIGVFVAVAVLGGIATALLRDNDTFQNVVFHTNEKSTSSVSSNDQRAAGLKAGVRDIIHEPLGGGVGSAGPASLRTTRTRIAENYFLQIGQELGVVGLILFVGALLALCRRLYRYRSDIQSRMILALTVGLVFINMVSHAWADDTLAYIFAALLGFVLVKTSTKSENLAKLA